jgi:hypothetical protein
VPVGEPAVVEAPGDVPAGEVSAAGVRTGEASAAGVRAGEEPAGEVSAGAAGVVETAATDEVDVSGAVAVPEPPAAPRAWQVPVLRAKRTPPAEAPPDAVVPPVPTEATEAEAPAAEGDVGSGGTTGTETDPPAGGGGEPGPRALRRIEARRGRTVKLRRQRRFAVVGMALLIGTGATLGLVGVDRVRGSTGGRYVDPKVRPDEPGYVALVTPTPTLLVLHKGSGGALSGVSLLSLHAQDEGGAVIVMPVTTMAPFADPGTTFADAYAQNGAAAVTTQVELTLNVAVGETVEVDDMRWAALVDPVAPIDIDLDKAVGEWPAGGADIPADDVGAFLAARTDSETELGRLDRQELFWETWLPQVRSGGRNAVPGEVDVGLGRFVRGLAAGDTEVTSLPVSAAFSAEEMYAPTEEMLPDLVAGAVPYPQEPSRGSRVQTQLLNGTGQRDLTARAATSLVAGGAEIALVGNAASFTEPTTRFVYTSTKTRDDAEKLRDAFGVGEVEQAPADDDAPPVDDDRIDVTVILGADALDALGG